MQHINLIDNRLLPPLRLLSGPRLAGLALAGAALVCGHGVYEQRALARALGATQAVETAGDDDAQTGSDGLAAQRDRVAQQESLRQLLAAEALPSEPAALLQAVIDALPPTVWLTEVEVAAERSLRIAGGTLDVAALDQFADRLNRVATLRGAPVSSLRLQHAAHDDSAQHSRADPSTPGPSWRFELAAGAASAVTK